MLEYLLQVEVNFVIVYSGSKASKVEVSFIIVYNWQLTGYPCVHRYACIASLNRDVEEYVSPWFTTSMFLNCYMYTINPLKCSDMWPHIEKENQGKKHSITKRGSVMKCNICRESGHNRTTCPQKPIEESSNVSSKRKNPKKTIKVKVALANEVDIENDSEVEMEPESEVESFDVEFEDDVQADVKPEVQAEFKLKCNLKFKLKFTLKCKLKFTLKCKLKST
uniref:Zinc finger PMZ-type domain-containing protein n=1 Tax=Lactuca sativa TaxID=4236 RepID=A0A9R1VA58_LACSA|nr:hypothetical protein LSAT_V11C600316560 [Lactuca sativa]